VRESQPSIRGGQVAAIAESVKCRRDPGFGSRKLGSSQGEGPRVGCSKSRSREIARSEDNRWIHITGEPLDQEPHRLSCVRGFEG
jgi:hypothetical protein